MGVGGLRSSISLSLVAHALLLLAWAILFGQQTARQVPKRLTWIEVEPFPKSLKKLKEVSKSHRVVQTMKGQRTETAPADAFLGEQNQEVDRQTVSRQKSTVMGQARERVQPREKGLQNERERALSRLGIPMPKVAKAPADHDEPQWATGEGLPEDYVKGMKESERTALNTKEFVFYGYFQRIRARLDLAWTSILREHLYKIYRGGRHLASDMDHTTRILVTLNGTGEIIRVQVVEESGTRDLDDAAIKAFNQAGPFPNPPRGIVDKDGNIQIRWDFVLKT
jgi:protein TonB